MENAVKALLIAAGVLIGGLILSIGISLYSSLSEYVELSQNEIINREIQEFNGQFTKYINWNDTTAEADFALTIQDIVTVANTAYESNLRYGLTETSDSNYYVTINMPGHLNLEKTIKSKSVEILSAELGVKYKCTIDDVKINPNTGRVCEINFSIMQ